MYVYHYTTMHGFLGIAQTRVLWATNMRYLNDASGFVHCVDVAREVRDATKTTLTSDETLLLDKLLRDDIPPNSIHGMLKSGLWHYVASLSAVPDSLPQWREYARKSGFAIGLPIQALSQQATNQGFSLKECVYDPAKQTEAVASLIEATLAEYRKHPFIVDAAHPELRPRSTEKTDNESYTRVHSMFETGLRELATVFKKQAFKEEAEWRLVSERWTGKFGAPKFRVGRSALVPYLDFQLHGIIHSGATIDIRCGPSPESALCEISAVNILGIHGWPNFRVDHSKIPYRDW